LDQCGNHRPHHGYAGEGWRSLHLYGRRCQGGGCAQRGPPGQCGRYPPGGHHRGRRGLRQRRGQQQPVGRQGRPHQ